ncbi:MAG: FAD-dependent oxidoreductase, partial [Chthonomonadales bacterium]
MFLASLFATFLMPPPKPIETPTAHYYQPNNAKSKPVSMNADICIYGGTASGVIAAVQARRLGRTVILINPSRHLGGMTSGGLSYTDFGNQKAIGGMAREFYQRLGKHYGVVEELKFEPHVAEKTLGDMAREAGVLIYGNQFLASITKANKRITSLSTEDGLTVTAR